MSLKPRQPGKCKHVNKKKLSSKRVCYHRMLLATAGDTELCMLFLLLLHSFLFNAFEA